MPEPTSVTNDQLIKLEQTVAALDDRLKHLQAGLWTAKITSPAKRLWILTGSRQTRDRAKRLWILTGSRQTRAFMSSVCNQHIRPNTKVTTHDGPST